MTRSRKARYHAPRADRRLESSSPLESADIVEQIFRIACTENLHPRPEEYDAATCDYAAEHGLSVTGMRQYGTLIEIHQRAQVIALMRFYRARWRPWDPEGRRAKGPSRQPKPEKPPRRKSPPKRIGRPPKRSPEANRDTPEDTPTLSP